MRLSKEQKEVLICCLKIGKTNFNKKLSDTEKELPQFLAKHYVDVVSTINELIPIINNIKTND